MLGNKCQNIVFGLHLEVVKKAPSFKPLSPLNFETSDLENWLPQNTVKIGVSELQCVVASQPQTKEGKQKPKH